MRGFLFNNVLALILLGSSLNLYGQGSFCPVNNTVELTCNTVAMEGLWARLGNDMNSLFAATNADLIAGLNTDATNTYTTITNSIDPIPFSFLITDFNAWWLAINDFYNTGNSNPLNSASNALGQTLALLVSAEGHLTPSQQAQLTAQLATSFTNLYNSIVGERNNYVTAQYTAGANFSAEVLKYISFIGVTVGKGLEGTVVGT
jgi:hypothetical protein